MAELVSFESATEKQKLREIRKKERSHILKEAEAEHERKARKKERARQQGEGTWMLQSVDERIKHDEQALQDALSSQKKKKKHKKEKSKKKKKKHSSSDSEGDDKLVWQEKTASPATIQSTSSADQAAKTIVGPRLERDSWMTDEVADIFSLAAEARRKRNAKAEARQAEADALDEVRSSRELNPYWKDGGIGLPPEHPDHNPPPPPTSGAAVPRMNDGGLSWWQKAYRRCTELAAEENRPLEEIAAERYGSLAALKAKLEAAEKAELHSQTNERSSHLKSYSSHFQRPGESRQSSTSCCRSSSDYQETASWRKKDSQSSHPKSYSSRFQQPGESQRSSTNSNHTLSDYGAMASWRKKDSRFISLNDSEVKDKKVCRDEGRRPEPTADVKTQPVTRTSEATRSQISTRKASKSSSSEDSDTDSTNSEASSSSSKAQDKADAGQHKPQQMAAAKQTTRILSEEELNRLGAKVLRAEMMGDESLATQLKAQLDAARSAKASHERNSASTATAAQSDEIIVLSRTDQRGMSRPLPDRKHAVELKRRRRKKEKVSTHSTLGARERYFDDDDNYNLQTMVEREKLGTAEDQNRMFARLASRSFGGTEEDYQVDDALIDRASRKQSQSHVESRERQLAIIEHKKMSSALDKCPYCFGNIPKHLIIAIGMKVCLIVPSHQSLNDSHCLIVPMQHVVQATMLDEDVWDEIKIFRKGLTRMFSDRGDDCIFMETCMNLKRYPHMVVECIPLPKEVGDMAPIYFKKAIQECEKEWADNKKLIDLSQKDIRRAVPKGFAYFCVDFGAQGGFAHVIEDEKSFPPYFGREVVGGMLDLEPQLWRKPHKERFEDQRRKVLRVAELWKPYDWTSRLRGDKE